MSQEGREILAELMGRQSGSKTPTGPSSPACGLSLPGCRWLKSRFYGTWSMGQVGTGSAWKLYIYVVQRAPWSPVLVPGLLRACTRERQQA